MSGGIGKRRAIAWATAALSAVSLLGSEASARPGADDLILGIFLASGNYPTFQSKTTSLSFQIIVGVDSKVGVRQTTKVTIGLPEGLRWGVNAPDASEGCMGTAPAVCTQTTAVRPSGTIGASWFWDVVAERSGSYGISASVTGSEPDPDLSNNTTTLQFEVVAGGSGGSGGGSSAKTSASSVRLSPAKPRAGSTVVASVRVTRGGSPVRPVGVTCAGSLGGAKVKGAPKTSSGVASCLFRTPRSARGKTLAGSVSFRTGGSSFTKRFSTRLG